MIKEVKKAWGAYQAAKNGRSLAIMEGPTNCNRACSYCMVHTKGANEASTLSETNRQTDWLYKQGFRVLNYVGGEPLAGSQFKGGVTTGRYGMCQYGVWGLVEDYTKDLAPYTTKEGLTYVKHTLGVVKHASDLGMLTNVTTNGDFVDNTYYLGELKRAGLDLLTFSLHSFNETGLKNLIGKARAAASEGIVPIVSVVFTADRTDTIPLYARTCAANGVLFSTSVVQEIGTGFSTAPDKSQIPSATQQKEVFEALLPLKKAGFILNNRRYLTEATNYPNNSWRCDSSRDTFIHIRAKGEKGRIGFCPEMPSGFYTDEIDLTSSAWRQKKQDMLKNCAGCLYSCYFQCENPDYTSDFATARSMVLIKVGQAGKVRRIGERAVGKNAEIIQVPQSELERLQAEVKDYYKLPNKFKRIGKDVINVLATPVVFALAVGGFTSIYIQARRKGIDPEEVFKVVALSTIYPRLLDNEPDSKKVQKSS